MDQFDELWTSVTKWAEAQAKRISENGRRLSQHEITVAKSVEVLSPADVRVLFVEQVPFPELERIQSLAIQRGLDPFKMGGLTLGHGIFICLDQRENQALLAHELRHVAQYEAFGSIASFMFFYLKELLHFGYGSGPLERDAEAAEIRAE